jgi:hypothetical protein
MIMAVPSAGLLKVPCPALKGYCEKKGLTAARAVGARNGFCPDSLFFEIEVDVGFITY